MCVRERASARFRNDDLVSLRFSPCSWSPILIDTPERNMAFRIYLSRFIVGDDEKVSCGLPHIQQLNYQSQIKCKKPKAALEKTTTKNCN